MLTLEPFQLTQPPWLSHFLPQLVQQDLGKSKFLKLHVATLTGDHFLNFLHQLSDVINCNIYKYVY